MTPNHKSASVRRRLAQAMLLAAVPVLAIGTSQSAWVDQVRVEATITFAPGSLGGAETAVAPFWLDVRGPQPPKSEPERGASELGTTVAPDPDE